MDSDAGKKTWWPAPADKYLPIWVVITMILSVLVLSWQILPMAKQTKDKALDTETSTPIAMKGAASNAASVAASAQPPKSESK